MVTCTITPVLCMVICPITPVLGMVTRPVTPVLGMVIRPITPVLRMGERQKDLQICQKAKDYKFQKLLLISTCLLFLVTTELMWVSATKVTFLLIVAFPELIQGIFANYHGLFVCKIASADLELIVFNYFSILGCVLRIKLTHFSWVYCFFPSIHLLPKISRKKHLIW